MGTPAIVPVWEEVAERRLQDERDRVAWWERQIADLHERPALHEHAEGLLEAAKHAWSDYHCFGEVQPRTAATLLQAIRAAQGSKR